MHASNANKPFIRTWIKPRSIDEEAKTLIALSYLRNPEVTVAELQAILHNKHEIRLTIGCVGYFLRQFKDNVRFLIAQGLVKPALVARLASPPAAKKPSSDPSPSARFVSSSQQRIVSAPRLSTPRRAILHTLMEASHPLGPMEIVQATGMGYGAVRFLLHRMVRDRQVVRTAYGRYFPAPAERPGRGPSREPGPGRWGHE